MNLCIKRVCNNFNMQFIYSLTVLAIPFDNNNYGPGNHDNNNGLGNNNNNNDATSSETITNNNGVPNYPPNSAMNSFPIGRTITNNNKTTQITSTNYMPTSFSENGKTTHVNGPINTFTDSSGHTTATAAK